MGRAAAEEGTSVDNSVVVVHYARFLYTERETWKHETCLKRVEEWDTVELRSWIEACVARRADESLRKAAALVPRLLDVMEEEDVDGALVLAGGREYLTEKAGLTIRNKADCMRLPHAVTLVLDAVQEAVDRAGRPLPYWDRLWTSSAAGHALCEEFGTAAGAGLRLALEPHPLDAVHFAVVRTAEAANVALADESVCDIVSPGSKCLFKVVSVAPRETPSEVWCNLIYARSDIVAAAGPSEGDEPAPVSRAERRHRKKRGRRGAGGKGAPRWELIASADFARHGSAPPGHWHLNRTVCGDVLPHLRISSGLDDAREVWHGAEDGCPLWWHFIPEGMMHKSVPPRLQSLIDEQKRCEQA